MKKTLIIAFLFQSFVSISYAQSPIVNINDWNGVLIPNFYLQDTNGVFNQFEGTWVYNSPHVRLEIILRKKPMVDMTNYFEDFLIGGYKLTKNGVVVYNFLLDADLEYPSPYIYKIHGSTIHKGLSPFDETIPGEKIVNLYLSEYTNVGANLFLRKINVNGQEAIQLLKIFSAADRIKGEPPYETEIPDGIYNLIKQP